MTKPDHSTIDSQSLAKSTGGKWLYPLVLMVETVGALVIYSLGLPIYRKLLSDPASHDPQPANLVFVLGASALIQLGYWVRYRIRPAPPRLHHVVLGHIVLFAARFSFLFASALFSFLFIGKALKNETAIWYAVILFALFALFCYLLELERFGKRLLREREE
jgi:drug/metabolite transporter (DMT)-like permease